MQSSSKAENSKPLFGLVLAAGTASRFGSSKLLVDFEGEPLVRRAVRLAENTCDELYILVTGHQSEDVHAACAPLRGFWVVNDAFETGMASSIAAGVRAVTESAGAILLLLADQPLITPQYIRQMINAWNNSDTTIVCSEFANSLGPPVIFPAIYFAELNQLEGDRGARALLDLHAKNVVNLPCEAAAIDIDVPGDLTALKSKA